MGIVFSKSSNVNNSFFGKSQEPIKMLLDREVDAFKEMSIIPKLFKEVKTIGIAFIERTENRSVGILDIKNCFKDMTRT